MCHIGLKTYPFGLQTRPKLKKNASNLIAKASHRKTQEATCLKESNSCCPLCIGYATREVQYFGQKYEYDTVRYISFDSDVWDRVIAVLREAGQFGRECG